MVSLSLYCLSLPLDGVPRAFLSCLCSFEVRYKPAAAVSTAFMGAFVSVTVTVPLVSGTVDDLSYGSSLKCLVLSAPSASLYMLVQVLLAPPVLYLTMAGAYGVSVE